MFDSYSWSVELVFNMVVVLTVFKNLLIENGACRFQTDKFDTNEGVEYANFKIIAKHKLPRKTYDLFDTNLVNHNMIIE